MTDRYDHVTLSYDTASGARLWATRHDRPGGSSEQAHDLAVSPDGDTVIVAGRSEVGSEGWNYDTVAYEASTGARMWRSVYRGPGGDFDGANAITTSPDGSAVFVTGVSLGLTGGYDFATVAYALTTGSERWVRRYDGPGHDADGANAVAASPDGSMVFVTGSSRTAGNYDFATVAYAQS